MLNEIIKLADHLDMIGEKEEASLLDEILPHIKNVEIKMEEEEEEEDSSYDKNYMLESQLASISEKSSIILSMLKSDISVDDWMETYIAQADLMIDNIYDKIITQYRYSDEKDVIASCGCKGPCKCNG